MSAPERKAERAGGWRSAVQIAGFVIGVGLLAYCVWMVASNETYRKQVVELWSKPGHLWAMFGLSCAILVFTGMMFRAVLKPVKTIPVADAAAVNSLCTLLGNAPFKLSLVVRVLIHTKRNELPLGVVVAWMGASAAVMVMSVGPPLAATLIVKELNGLWWLIAGGGTVIWAAVTVVIGRVVSRESAWSALQAWCGRRAGWLGRLARSKFALHVREWLMMLSDWRTVGEAMLWRTLDFVSGSARFIIAASAIGAAITLDQAAAADSAYFLIQTAAPTGALGTREAGTIAVLKPMIGESLPVMILAVSAVETAANLVLGLIGAMYLRVWALWRERKAE